MLQNNELNALEIFTKMEEREKNAAIVLHYPPRRTG